MSEDDDMSEDSEDRVEAIFHHAVSLPPESREAYLNEACAGDPALRQLIDSMLAEMTLPASPAATKTFVTDVDGATLSADPPGSSRQRDREIPSRIDRYEIKRELGRGGFGVVYQAYDPRLDRDVAIKQLLAVRAQESSRFLQEAQFLANLDHPNIGRIFELDEWNGSPYFTMEFVEGNTLAQLLTHGPIELLETIRIAHQIAKGLDHAHSLDLVHRDLKPDNIKIGGSGRVKVLDFGIAKLVGVDPMSDQEATQIGTPAYMSPEQWQGTGVDGRTDVWALGCVLFECLSGRRPHSSADSTLNHDPDWSLLPIDIPNAIIDLIRGCLQKSRTDRIANMTRFCEAIGQQVRATSDGHEPASARPVFRSGALIGLENARARVSEFFDRQASGSLLLVRGPSGSGKSTLLDVCAQDSEARDTRVLRGYGARSIDQPIKILHDFLIGAIGTSPTTRTGETLMSRTHRILNSWFPDESPMVDYFEKAAAGESLEILPSPFRSYRWFRLLSSASRGQSLTLLVDDLDEGDPESIQILADLLERARQARVPISVVASIGDRPSAEPNLESLAPLLSGDVAEELRMPQVQLEEITRWIHASYPGASHEDDLPWLSGAIAERTAGRHSRVQRLIRYLARAKRPLLAPEGKKHWRVARSTSKQQWLNEVASTEDDEGLPEALGTAEAELLECAALLGGEFDVEILEEHYGADLEVDEAIDSLESQGFISNVPRYPDRYRFVSGTAPAAVVRRGRQRGRRKFGKLWLKLVDTVTSMPEKSEKMSGWIGRSLHELGQSERAFGYLMSALERHVSRGHFDAARSTISAIETTDPTHANPSDRLRFLLAKAKIETQSGSSDLALEMLEEAFSLGSPELDAKREFEARWQRVGILVRSGRREDAGQDLERAEELVSELDKKALRNHRRQLANVKSYSGDLQGAKELLESIVDDSGADTTAAERGTWFHTLGIAQYRLGDDTGAAKSFAQAIQLLKAAGRLDHLQHAQQGMSATKLRSGDLEQARDLYLDILGAQRELQDRWGLGRTYFNLALVHALLGELDRALSSIERALRFCRESGDRSREATYEVNHGKILLELGDRDAGKASIDRALEIDRASDAPSQIPVGIESEHAWISLTLLRDTNALESYPELDDAPNPATAQDLGIALGHIRPGQTVPADLRNLVTSYLSEHPSRFHSVERCRLAVLLSRTLQSSAGKSQDRAEITEIFRSVAESRDRLAPGAPVDEVWLALSDVCDSDVERERLRQIALEAFQARARLIRSDDIRARFLARRDHIS